MGVILENFLAMLLLTGGPSTNLNGNALHIIHAYAASMVQVFFVISGYGLTHAFLMKDITHWGSWMQRRFSKIVVPYWILVTLTFAVVAFIPSYADKASRSGISWVAYVLFFRTCPFVLVP